MGDFGHAVGDHHEDGGERGERNVFSERSGDEENEKQGEAVDHGGTAGAGAVFDVGGGAGDGAGGWNSAKEWQDDISYTLRN